jgi:hypothetical protein
MFIVFFLNSTSNNIHILCRNSEFRNLRGQGRGVAFDVKLLEMDVENCSFSDCYSSTRGIMKKNILLLLLLLLGAGFSVEMISEGSSFKLNGTNTFSNLLGGDIGVCS